LENAANVDAGLAIRLQTVVSVAHQTTGHGESTLGIDCRNLVTQRESGETIACPAEKSIPIDQERADTHPTSGCEGRLHLVHSLSIQDDDLLSDVGSRRLQVRRICFTKEICWVREKADDGRLGHEFAHKFEALYHQFAGEKCHACYVAPRPIQTCN